MIDYNAFVKHKLEYMPMRQFAKIVGATPLTVARWRDGSAISYKYKQVLDRLEREEHNAFYRAIVQDGEEIANQ